MLPRHLHPAVLVPGSTIATKFSMTLQTIVKLQRAQNYLAHIGLQQRKSCRAQPLLKSLHWLPIFQRIDFKLATLASKTQTTSHPEYLRQLISSQYSSSSMSLHSSTRLLLHTPCTWTGYSSHAFSSAAPAIWNKLPTTVLEANSLRVFHVNLRHICLLLRSTVRHSQCLCDHVNSMML